MVRWYGGTVVLWYCGTAVAGSSTCTALQQCCAVKMVVRGGMCLLCVRF